VDESKLRVWSRILPTLVVGIIVILLSAGGVQMLSPDYHIYFPCLLVGIAAAMAIRGSVLVVQGVDQRPIIVGMLVALVFGIAFATWVFLTDAAKWSVALGALVIVHVIMQRMARAQAK